MRIETLYQEFLSYLKIERNCSPMTIEAYASDGKVFLRVLDHLGVEPDTEQVTRQVLRQYIVWHREREMSSATIARRINSLRSFWKYIWNNEYVDLDPFRGLSIPKQSRELPTYLSAEECRRMLDATQMQKSPLLRARDRALLTFMVFTGARRSEVLNLQWPDVDLPGRVVRFVAAKGDKTRAVPLAEDVCAELTRWREVRRECDHEYVFTSRCGRRMSRQALGKALRGALMAAGIDKPGITPHKLRHSFACMMVKNSADLNCLQRMLGHTRLDTTGIYLQATAEDLRQAILKHPLSTTIQSEPEAVPQVTVEWL